MMSSHQRHSLSALTRAEYSTASQSVKDQLRHAILSGVYPSGSRLPSEKELAEMLGISRSTLRECLRTLEEQGLIARRRGVGTFVCPRPILKNLSLNYGITEMIRSAGFMPGTAQLSIHTDASDAETADVLQIATGEQVMTIERVRTAEGRPIVCSRDVFPASLVQGHEDSLKSLSTSSLYTYFLNELGISIHHGLAKLCPISAHADLAGLLKVRRGSPLLYIRQLDYVSDGRPILLSHEYHIADAFEITVYRTGPGDAV
jgi:GntR family transcriptional regulator